jgi:methionyl-tRNA formyltransferase
MKIAYFGYDFFFSCLKLLVKCGHEIVSVHTFLADNKWDFNEKIIEIASEIGTAVHLDRPSDKTVTELKRLGCELVISAGYPYKIPNFDQEKCDHLIRGINIHPTLLPNGRGRWPLPWLILKYPNFAGVTIHKLTDKWDSGDILCQVPVAITPTDDLETLSSKCQIEAVKLLEKTIIDFDRTWLNASKQPDSGSYWPMPKPSDRHLDWNRSVDSLLRIVRSFGKFESNASVNGLLYSVTKANGWIEERKEPIGTLVHETNLEKVIAVQDGYIVLQEFKQMYDPRTGITC